MKTIAVVGCVDHIGTTTQSVQLVLALKENNYRACYHESNQSKYVSNLVKANKITENIMNVEYKEITMYKSNFLKAIAPWNWDYLVRDYGSIYRDSFDEKSYLNQEVKIIVCGSKPNEIFELQKILLNPEYKDSIYIFSFVPVTERISLLSLMGNRQDQVFFSNIILDPYTLIFNKDIYNKVVLLA